MEKVFLASGLVLSAVLVLVVSTSSAQAPAAINQPAFQKTEIAAPLKNGRSIKDTPQEPQLKKKSYTGTITSDSGGTEYTLVVKDNTIEGFFVNSERVPQEKFDEFKTLTDKLIKQAIENRERTDSELARMKEKIQNQNIENDKLNLFVQEQNKVKQQQQDQMMKVEESKWKEQANDQEWKLKTDQLQWKQEQKRLFQKNLQNESSQQTNQTHQKSWSSDQYRKEIQYRFQQIEQSTNKRALDINQLEVMIDEYVRKMEKEGEDSKDTREQFRLYKERIRNIEARPRRKEADKPRKPQLSMDAVKANIKSPVRIEGDRKKKTVEIADAEKMKLDIINDLKEGDILPKQGPVIVELNYSEMRINGKKKGKNIHNAFKQKYLQNPSDRIFFTF